MKIVFLLNSKHSLRFYSTIIFEATKRNYLIEIWLKENLFNMGNIKSLLPYFENKSKIKYLLYSDLEKQLTDCNSVDFFFSQNPININLSKELLQKINKKFCILQHGHDSFSTIWGWKRMYGSINLLQNYERFFFASSLDFYNSKLQWMKNHPIDSENKENYKFFDKDKTSVFPVGFTLFDNNLASLDKDLINKKYNFKKKVLLYLPFVFLPGRAKYELGGNFSWQCAFTEQHKMFLNSSSYRDENQKYSNKFKQISYPFFKSIRYFFELIKDKKARMWSRRNYTEKSVLNAIRIFCDKNDLHLVIKSKDGHNFNKSLLNREDIFISDDGNSYYPTVLQEILSVSSLVVGYGTTAVYESIISNTPHLNLQPPPDNIAHSKLRMVHHHAEVNSVNNFPGVVSKMDIPEAISKMCKMKVSDFSIIQSRRKIFMKSFTGQNCLSSSVSILDFLESRK